MKIILQIILALALLHPVYSQSYSFTNTSGSFGNGAEIQAFPFTLTRTGTVDFVYTVQAYGALFPSVGTSGVNTYFVLNGVTNSSTANIILADNDNDGTGLGAATVSGTLGILPTGTYTARVYVLQNTTRTFNTWTTLIKQNENGESINRVITELTAAYQAADATTASNLTAQLTAISTNLQGQITTLSNQVQTLQTQVNSLNIPKDNTVTISSLQSQQNLLIADLNSMKERLSKVESKQKGVLGGTLWNDIVSFGGLGGAVINGFKSFGGSGGGGGNSGGANSGFDTPANEARPGYYDR